jgi:hypothetical protein
LILRSTGWQFDCFWASENRFFAARQGPRSTETANLLENLTEKSG